MNETLWYHCAYIQIQQNSLDLMLLKLISDTMQPYIRNSYGCKNFPVHVGDW